MTIFLDGVTIYELDVADKVRKTYLFQKVFIYTFSATASAYYVNPYTQNISIDNLQYNITSISRELAAIKSTIKNFSYVWLGPDVSIDSL